MTMLRFWAFMVGLAFALSCGQEIIIPNGHVRGVVVVSGPLVGAVVRAFRVGSDGAPGELLGESAPSGADGSFEIAIGRGRGVLYLEAAGPATYRELSGGGLVSLDPGPVVSGVALGVAANEQRDGVVVSGLTHLAVALSRARMAAGKHATYEEAVARSYVLIGQHFFEIDIGTTRPADISTPSTALVPAVRYALVLAGLSKLAQTMGKTSLPVLSLNDASSVILFHELADDIARGLFDGMGANGALTLGNCAGMCALRSATVRTDLASALIAFLGSPEDNKSGQGYDQVIGRITALTTNKEPELFPPDDGDPDPIDVLPPVITWVAPRHEDIVSGAIALEVYAQDATQVASVTVIVGGAPGPADSNSAADRYQGELMTQGLADGPLVLTATASDATGNSSSASVTVTVNNVGPGTINGVCMKGPVRVGTAIAYRYIGGVKGAPIGSTATTDLNGAFRIMGVEDYSGPLLITCGGPGSYKEEAFDFETEMTARDQMRTVIPDFASNSANVTLTPFTSLAVVRLEHLLGKGVPFAQAHTQAYGEIGDLLGVGDLAAARPVRLDVNVTTLTDASWSAFLLAGLSQLASTLAQQGSAPPGASANAMIVWQKLEADLADGCLDGKDRGQTLQVAGVALTSQTLRYDLALAISTYLRGAFNPTPIRSAAAAIDYLDALTVQGPTVVGATCAPGQLFPDPGHASFDRTGPEITWDPLMPTSGAYLDGGLADMLTIRASARDDLSPRPVLRFVAPPTPPWMLDQDGDATNSTVSARIQPMFEGDIQISVEARDDAGNISSLGPIEYHVDRSGLSPIITLLNVTRTDGWTHSSTVGIQVTSPDPQATLNVELDEVPIGVNAVEDRPGAHTVFATATDRANNTGEKSATFVIDTNLPQLLEKSFPVPETGCEYVKGGGILSVTAALDDAYKGLGGDVNSGSLPMGDGQPPLLTAVVSTGLQATQTLKRDVEGRLELQVLIPLYDGAVSVDFSGADRAGNSAAPLRWSQVIDSQRPVATVTLTGSDLVPLSPLNRWTRGSVTVGVDVKTESGQPENVATPVKVDATIGSLKFVTLPQTISDEGFKPVSVIAFDKACWEAGLEQTDFYIDKKAPVIEVTPTYDGAVDGGVTYVRDRLAFTATLKEVATTEGMSQQLAGSLEPPATFVADVQMYGAVKLALAPPTLPPGDMSRKLVGELRPTLENDGPVTVTLSGTDRAGNVAVGNEPARYLWRGTIDTRPPVAKIYFSGSFPPADDRWTASAVTVQAKAEHADGTLETNPARIDLTIGTTTTTTPNNALSDARSVAMPEGQYDVKARATDKAGWSSLEAADGFVLDLMNPAIGSTFTVTPAIPASGWLKEGSYQVKATMTDTLMSIGSLQLSKTGPQGLVTLAQFVGTPRPVPGNVQVTVGAAQPGAINSLEIAATVTVSQGAFGTVAIDFTGNDRAKRAAAGQTFTAKVDTAGPTVGGLPAEGTWTGKSAVVAETVISGTDVTTKYLLPLTADDRVGGVAGSGLDRVEVYRGAVLVGSKAWVAGTQNVPSDTVKIDLVAKTNDCSETAARNSLTIKVADVAGNVTEVPRTLYLDVCPPVIVVNATQMLDEKNYEQPLMAERMPPFCLKQGTASFTTILSAPVTPAPKVYKYRVNYDNITSSAHCRFGVVNNRMLWALNVSDTNGLATSAPVAYTLKYSTTVSKAGVAATSAVGSGRTHEILVTTDLEPKVAELDGRWRLEVKATDKFGNVSATPMNLEWDQYLIDGPVKVEEVPISVGSTNFHSWGIVNPLPYGLESGKDMTPLSGSVGPLALRGYRVRNYTPYDIYLKTTPLVTANIERSLLERNVFVSTTSAHNLSCARFTPGTASATSCLVIVPGLGATSAYNETGKALSPFVMALYTSDTSPGTYTSAAEGCPANSTAWCDANTWKVKKHDGAVPGVTDYYVVVPTLFPWPNITSTGLSDTVVTGSDLYGRKTYGTNGWGRNVLDESLNWHIERYDLWQFETWFKVATAQAKSDLGLPMRDGNGAIRATELSFSFVLQTTEDQILPIVPAD